MKLYRKIISNIILITSIILFSLSFNRHFSFSAFMDFVIFIDAGHGGKDNGANYLDIYEDEINYQIASKLYDICIAKNIITYITRTGDYDLSSQYASNRKREDLYKRSECINQSDCDCYISIHVNQYDDSDVKGPMVYFEKGVDDSYRLAKNIQEELNVLTNEKKVIHEEEFYLFKKCNPPGVLIECGFISNEEERIKLLDDDYQLSLAQAIYKGIYNYYLEL